MAKKTVIDLNLLEAEFWDRPPEEIHADVQAIPGWPQTPRKTKTLVEELLKEMGAIPEAERPIALHLPGRLVKLWRTAAPAEKEKLTDYAVAYSLRHKGVAAFSDPAIQSHLDQLWALIRSGRTTALRQKAKARWRSIMLSPLPNVRNTKDPVDLVALAQAMDEARHRLKPIRSKRWRAAPALRLSLKENFPDWPGHIIHSLAQAILAKDRAAVRKALGTGVGQSFGRAPGSLPELVAMARRLADLQRRTKEGRQRYDVWLKQQGLTAPPTLALYVPMSELLSRPDKIKGTTKARSRKVR